MLRIALAATTAGLATLGGGYLALNAAGEETAPAPIAAAPASSPMVATATNAPPERSITPATSITFSVGFVGVSIHTSFVSGRTEAATRSRSVWSTIV